MKKHSYLFLFYGILALPRLALGGCEYLADGLERKMSAYRAFRTANEQTERQLRDSETECKVKGQTISGRAGQLANSAGCEAQKEANTLNREISELGKSCEGSFTELKEVQETMHSHFQTVRNDLEDGLKALEKDELIKKYCKEEMKVARTMAEAFITLETNILATKTQSIAGEASYQNLRETGRMLAEKTQSLRASCGSTEESAAETLSKSGTSKHGQGGAGVKGKSKNPQSDISGTEKSIRDKKQGEAIINTPQR